MIKRVLITGGAGFIGSNLANRLLDLNYEVTVLDNLSPQIHGNNPEITSPLYLSIKNKVTFILGSVNERPLLEEALEDIDVVVHLAAETGTGQSMYEIERYNSVNIGGTALLLDILTNKPNKVSKVVIASSRSIYGEGKYLSEKLGVVYPEHRADEDLKNGNFDVTIPGKDDKLKLVATDEDSKIHPSSVYGITKQVQEQLVMTVTKSIGIAGVSLRYQNVYGPGQSLSNPYTGILSIFSTRIRNNSSINIFEDGLESRDFVYIDDVVNATILGIEKEEANGQIFNVGSGIPTSVNKVVDLLIENYGIEVPISITGNYRIGDIRHNFADLTKIKFLLGYTPTVSFENGIKMFVKWVLNQNLTEDKYEISLEEMKNKGLFK
jgi:dTDP-L-rhamnose 4-epimerase